ncbi:Leucine Rich repeat [Novymonas esmeraldas]|uniref:Leucine Rich repeat n=1 Tax=Novymonas esmeraldas TaxID=1808958 RepID=A0AAW0EWQ7_9TRYP
MSSSSTRSAGARSARKTTTPRRATVSRAVESGSSAATAAHPGVSSSPVEDTPRLGNSAQERAVEAIKAAIPASASRDELRKDPIYRIMHALPRSDVLEVVRSRLAQSHCERAAAYFDLSYTKNPLRHLRLQLGCDGPTGVHLFFSRIAAHRETLRVVDFSRNRLTAEDAVLLCNTLGFGRAAPPPNTQTANCASASASPSSSSSLELLDLSYNARLGNDGATHVLSALRRCPSVRAVVLKSVGVDDAGAASVAELVRGWPAPVPHTNSFTPHVLLRPATASATKFFLNLNENYIGAQGTCLLGNGLPSHVSVTVSKQRREPERARKRPRDDS